MQICQRAPSLPPRSTLVDKCFPHDDDDDDGRDIDYFDDVDEDVDLLKCCIDEKKQNKKKCPIFPWCGDMNIWLSDGR